MAPPEPPEPPTTERIVLTTVVLQEEWRADPVGVRTASRDRIRERAAQRGLVLVSEPEEELQTMAFAERVRLTLSADVVPRTVHDVGPGEEPGVEPGVGPGVGPDVEPSADPEVTPSATAP